MFENGGLMKITFKNGVFNGEVEKRPDNTSEYAGYKRKNKYF